MSKTKLTFADKVEVVNQEGSLISWATPDIAQEFVDQGKAKPYTRNVQIRCLVWIGPAVTPANLRIEDKTLYKPSTFRQTKYSHNHETPDRGRIDDTVEKVWTLLRILNRDRAIFTAVLDGCVTDGCTTADATTVTA